MKKVALNEVVAVINTLKDQVKILDEVDELLKEVIKLDRVELSRVSISKRVLYTAIGELNELAKVLTYVRIEEPEVKPEDIKHFAVAGGRIDFNAARVHSPEYIEVMNFIQDCYLKEVVPAGKLRGVVESNVAGFYNNIREQLGIIPGNVVCFLDAGGGDIEILSPETEKSIVVVGLNVVDIYIALCNIPLDETLITTNE